MRHKIINTNTNFTPFTIEIKVESLEDLIDLCVRFNASLRCLEDSFADYKIDLFSEDVNDDCDVDIKKFFRNTNNSIEVWISLDAIYEEYKHKEERNELLR